jgi:transposase
MAKGKRQELYDLAMYAFVYEGKSLMEVQKALPVYVSMQSLSKWSREGEWTKEREKQNKEAFFSTRDAIDVMEQQLKQKISRLKEQGDISDKDADEIEKITARLDRMRANSSLNAGNELQKIRIMQDKAKALLSEVGEDNMVLSEAASNVLSQKLLELLLSEESIDLAKSSRIMADFAKLQSSSIILAKAKAELQQKVKATAQEVAKIVRAEGLSDAAAQEIQDKVLDVVD